MELKTKYNVGDYVWFVTAWQGHHQAPNTVKAVGCLKIVKIVADSTGRIEYLMEWKDESGRPRFTEGLLHETKEEALAEKYPY